MHALARSVCMNMYACLCLYSVCHVHVNFCTCMVFVVFIHSRTKLQFAVNIEQLSR